MPGLRTLGAVDSDGGAWVGFHARTGSVSELHDIEAFAISLACPSNTCGDGDPCTTDTCVSATGCVHVDAGTCQDGEACTSSTCDMHWGCRATPDSDATLECIPAITPASLDLVAWVLVGQASVIDGDLPLSSCDAYPDGTAWYPEELPVGNGFTLGFDAYFTDADAEGADGLCLFIANVAATSSSSAMPATSSTCAVSVSGTTAITSSVEAVSGDDVPPSLPAQLASTGPTNMRVRFHVKWEIRAVHDDKVGSFSADETAAQQRRVIGSMPYH